MNDALTVPPSDTATEAVPLAQELGRARQRVMDQLRAQHGLDASAALSMVESMTDFAEHHAAIPDNLLTWLNLDAIARHDPARAAERWKQLKREACAELSSGHRAAQAVETDDANCQQRARFLAVRDELINEWRPNTGLERLLIDTMSQAITMQERWLKRLVLLDTLDGPDGEPTPYQAPRVAIATAIEQAAGMVERFNRLFMRAVRQLRDLRRFAPQVIVQNAGQVNVGNHQLNVDGRAG